MLLERLRADARTALTASELQGNPRIFEVSCHVSATHARLREWARAEGLPEFTFYAARHTWATVARSSDAGVPYPVVEDCLNHKAAGLLDIYAERDWRTLDDANARVLALFRWPSDE